MTPRDFQSEDVAAVLAAHETHQAVLGRAATGLGKAVELGLIARHYMAKGRVMVLVDVRKLVEQLTDTIHAVVGLRPGVEMGDQQAQHGGFFASPDPIVVSTVQTQYSGEPGRERMRRCGEGYSALLLDECELFLAPSARAVVEYYRQTNPGIRIFGCTATPFRTDGTAMANLFDHLAFDRDILWGIDNGWLVPARQAFVRVSLDFSGLKVRRQEDGEKDYSADEIGERIVNERTLVELAKGILHVSGERRSIVVCPNVASAKAVAHYLCADRTGCARVVYGEMDDDAKDQVMDAHQAGAFQYLVSVMMLTKGYDDPQVQAIFNCRKTRSKRLYTQILGRGTRPLKGLLDGAEDAAERKALIAASAKPNMLMVNMVGVEDAVRDIQVIDILGEKLDEKVRERAKKKMLESEAEADPEEEASRATAEQEAEETRRREEAERRQRAAAEIPATVEAEYHDDLRTGGGHYAESRLPSRQLAILQKAKVEPDLINRLSPEAAKKLTGEIVRRWREGLCSYKQAKLLSRFGYGRDELHDMKREDATANIESIKANGWRRPVVELEGVI